MYYRKIRINTKHIFPRSTEQFPIPIKPQKYCEPIKNHPALRWRGQKNNIPNKTSTIIPSSVNTELARYIKHHLKLKNKYKFENERWKIFDTYARGRSVVRSPTPPRVLGRRVESRVSGEAPRPPLYVRPNPSTKAVGGSIQSC